jgi:hypothetical protein
VGHVSAAKEGIAPMSKADNIKSDIRSTRAELAHTVDALAAKFDVKTQAGARAHDAGQKAIAAFEHAKAATPEPMQHAVGKLESAAAPAVAKVSGNKKRAALIFVGVVAAAMVARRLLSSGS